MTILQPTPGADTGHRELWVDNLRVLVIAGVIVVHTATAYVVDVAGWYYDDERTSSDFWSTLMTVPSFFGAVFALGPLFLVGGWFAVRSIVRRGPAGYVWSRVVRLGVPVVVFLLLINPLCDYLGNVRTEDQSFLGYLPTTEVSVMWFALALLLFSLVFAAYENFTDRSPSAQPLRLRLLVVAALAITAGSFVVWLAWPLDRDVVLNLRLGAWPQGAVLFALGVHAARAGWLTTLSPRVQSLSGWVVVASTMALLALLAMLVDPDQDELQMRADAPTLLFAFLDGVIAVAFAVWFLAWLQLRCPTHRRLMDKAARASFATYFIHPLVLTLLMLGFSIVPFAPELKFVVVAAVAVPVCFTVGYALTRLPLVSRVL